MGCVSDLAYIAAAKEQNIAIWTHAGIDIAIQQVMAKYQRDSNRAITKMQQEIADRQMKLAEAIQVHAELFWPKESALVTEAFNTLLAQPDYSLASVFSNQTVGPFQAAGAALVAQPLYASAETTEESIELTNRQSRFRSLVVADISAAGFRTAEARATELNDRRYERQYKVIGVGKGMLSEVYGFQRSALVAGSAAGAMRGAAINAALDALGFGYGKLSAKMWGYGSAIRSNWESRVPAPTTNDRGFD